MGCLGITLIIRGFDLRILIVFRWLDNELFRKFFFWFVQRCIKDKLVISSYLITKTRFWTSVEKNSYEFDISDIPEIACVMIYLRATCLREVR